MQTMRVLRYRKSAQTPVGNSSLIRRIGMPVGNANFSLFPLLSPRENKSHEIGLLLCVASQTTHTDSHKLGSH
jgi:hypothetical protein